MDNASGVILIDKPRGPTSHDVVQTVKSVLGVEKLGHSGTLDPNASGLLLMAANEATKAMPVFVGLDKEYEGIMQIHSEIPHEKIKHAFKSFIGKLIQIPPVRSAVARRPRERELHLFEILDIDGKDVKFKAKCQSGFYIRKLCSDVGEKLGIGAHLKALRRTNVGDFKIEEAVKPEDACAEKFISIEDAVKRASLKIINITEQQAEKIRNGAPIQYNHPPKEELIGLFLNGKILALARPRGNKIFPDRVFK